MTLVDTRRGIQASLEAMAEEMAIEGVDAEVGDHTSDMQAAKLGDARAIGIVSGQSSAKELLKAGADNVLTHSRSFLTFLYLPFKGNDFLMKNLFICADS